MATQSPGQDFPTVGTDVVIPGANALFNMLFGPGFSTMYGNHEATFGRNPELVGNLFPGGWYPYQRPNVPPGQGLPEVDKTGGSNFGGASSFYGGQVSGGGIGGGIGTTQGSRAPINFGTNPNDNNPRPGRNPNYNTAGGFDPGYGGLMGSVIPSLLAEQAGWYASSGPQGDYNYMNTWQPSMMNSTPLGMKAAYFGGGQGGMPGAVDSQGRPIQGALDRFMDAEASYDRRYGTAVYNDAQGNQVPEGTPGARKVLPSWEELSGLRGSTQLGGYDPGQGYGVAKAGTNTDIYKGFQDYLSQNPLAGQDPLFQLRHQRELNDEGPEVQELVRRAQLGLGNVSQAGVDQTSQLNNKYTQDLISGIDTEASQNLTKKFQEQQAALEAAGLGSSGAAMRLQMQAQNEITAQANRDKQRVLADLTESNLGRQAQAINIGTQGQIQGGLQGMELNAGAAEAGRQRMTGALQQGLDRQMQGGLTTQGQVLNALSGGDEAALNRQIQQANINHMGLEEFMSLQAEKDSMRERRRAELFDTEDRMRSLHQEKLNMQKEAQGRPMSWLMQMITGVPTGGAGPMGRTNPWESAAASAAGGIGQGIGQYIGNYAQGRGNQLWGDPGPANAGLYGG